MPNNPEDKLTSETGSDRDSAKKIKQDNVLGERGGEGRPPRGGDTGVELGE